MLRRAVVLLACAALSAACAATPATPTPTPRILVVTATPAPVAATATVPASPPPPVATPTPDLAALRHDLDVAWARGDSPEVIRLLEELTVNVPDAREYAEFRDKLYAAHYNYGEQLLAEGDRAGAVRQFEAAQDVDGMRGEAFSALLALTPTPFPRHG
jgi:hypothetical protein